MLRLRLIGLRSEKGLTIEKVAEELTRRCEKSEKYGIQGVSAAAYGSWERGQRNPSLDQLCLLADFYGVSTDFLLRRTETRPEGKRPILEELGIERDEWWAIRREITPDERACAKVFAWVASGKGNEEILAMSDGEDWRKSKWGQKPDITTVHAMLMMALDDSAVDIIADEIPQDEVQAKTLRKEFPFLRQVRVVESSENQLLTKMLVGEVAALFFESIVRSGHSVGLSGGTTLARMAIALKKYTCTGINLYPFENGIVPELVDESANTLIGQIKYSHPAANIDAYAFQYFSFDDSRRPYKFPPSHPSVLRVLSGAENIDVGFVGFGATIQDHFWNNPSMLNVLAAAGMSTGDLGEAAGDILYQYIKENGDYIEESKLNKRIGGMKPQRLRELAKGGKPIVGVACGAVKGKAGLAVLNGRYVNNLVIDDKLAAAVLEAKMQFDKRKT